MNPAETNLLLYTPAGKDIYQSMGKDGGEKETAEGVKLKGQKTEEPSDSKESVKALFLS